MDFEFPNVGGISNLSSACKENQPKTPNETSVEEQRGETLQDFPLLFFQLVLLLGWKHQSLSKCSGSFVTLGFPPGREPTLDPGSCSWDPGILALGMP